MADRSSVLGVTADMDDSDDFLGATPPTQSEAKAKPSNLKNRVLANTWRESKKKEDSDEDESSSLDVHRADPTRPGVVLESDDDDGNVNASAAISEFEDSPLAKMTSKVKKAIMSDSEEDDEPALAEEEPRPYKRPERQLSTDDEESVSAVILSSDDDDEEEEEGESPAGPSSGQDSGVGGTLLIPLNPP